MTAIPFFLQGKAAMTFRTQIKGKADTLKLALKLLKDTFLSEEARRANDIVWNALSVELIRKQYGIISMREKLRHLFKNIERLRNSISHAAKTDHVAIAYITRAKLLASVSGIYCFQHVRANPPEEIL